MRNFQKKISSIFNFFAKFRPDRTLKSDNHFQLFKCIPKQDFSSLKILMEIPKHICGGNISEFMFHLGKCICVRWPLLFLFPRVLVLWQRAVNRQPSFRSGNSKGRSPSRYQFLIFSDFFAIPKNFQRAMIYKNYFFMVKSICVQPPLLARLAM